MSRRQLPHLRDEFARSTARDPWPLPPSRTLTGAAPWQRGRYEVFSVTSATAEQRNPTWTEIGLLVLCVTTVCAGLLFILLERSALYLDRQMELIAISRESSSPVTTTVP